MTVQLLSQDKWEASNGVGMPTFDYEGLLNSNAVHGRITLTMDSNPSPVPELTSGTLLYTDSAISGTEIESRSPVLSCGVSSTDISRCVQYRQQFNELSDEYAIRNLGSLGEVKSSDLICPADKATESGAVAVNAAGTLTTWNNQREGRPAGWERAVWDSPNSTVGFAWRDAEAEYPARVDEAASRIGLWTGRRANGTKLFDGNYVAGEKTGPWKFYDCAGNLIASGAYSKNLQDGHWQFNGGDLALEGDYTGGKKTGVWRATSNASWEDWRYTAGARGEFVDGTPDVLARRAAEAQAERDRQQRADEDRAAKAQAERDRQQRAEQDRERAARDRPQQTEQDRDDAANAAAQATIDARKTHSSMCDGYRSAYHDLIIFCIAAVQKGSAANVPQCVQNFPNGSLIESKVNECGGP